jgi:hypothetical protein
MLMGEDRARRNLHVAEDGSDHLSRLGTGI